jgi:hypothetical protein
MKRIFLFCSVLFFIETLDAQRDTVQVRFDTVPTSPITPVNKDKQLLEEIQRDIEKQNGKTSPAPVIKYYEVVEKPKIKERKERVLLATPPKHYKHEVSLETGAFFKQIFRLFGLVRDSQSFPVSPYLVAYKYRPNKKGAIRFGVGADFDKKQEQLGGFADNKTIKSSNYDIRLGYERTFPIDDRWVFMLGADASAGFSKTTKTFDSGFDRSIRTLSNKGFGLGLVAGIRYDFGWRISLGSETSLGFVNNTGVEKDEFTANPQFNKKIRDSKEQTVRFIGPANVYLSIRF